jgi:hypothetical protein
MELDEALVAELFVKVGQIGREDMGVDVDFHDF